MLPIEAGFRPSTSLKGCIADCSALIEICDGTLVVEVCDHGQGGARVIGGGGLLGLRDRVAAFDGVLEVESPPGHGTTVCTRLPLEQAQPTGVAEP